MKKEKVKDGKLGLFEGYSLGVGCIIGAGIFSMTGMAIGMTGSSACICYLLAAVILSFGLFPHLIMCSTIPTTSCSYYYAGLINCKIGPLYTVCWFLRQFTMAFLALTFGNYLNSLIPSVNPRIVAMILLTVLFAVNLLGPKMATRVQTVMNIIMLVALISFVAFGLPRVNMENYTNPDSFITNGTSGIMSVIGLLLFTLGGGLTLPEIGSEVRNPKRNIILAYALVTITGAIIFAVVTFVAGGVLPVSESANQVLTVTARVIYPSTALVIFFVAGGALMAAATTVNGNITGAIGAVTRSSEEGWFPSILSRPNKHGVAVGWTIAIYIVSMIPLVFNLPQSVMGKLAAGMTTLAQVVPNFALFFVAKRAPEAWKASPFHMPDWARILIGIVCNAVLCYFAFLNLKDLPTYLLIVIAVILVASIVYFFFREPVYHRIMEEKKARGEVLVK